MSKYVLAYHGGKRFETREEGQAHMKKWNAWNDGLGKAVINPGMYFGMSKTVSQDGVEDGGGSNPLSGITILEADDMEAALEMAKACPHVDIGGIIEVAEIMQM